MQQLYSGYDGEWVEDCMSVLIVTTGMHGSWVWHAANDPHTVQQPFTTSANQAKQTKLPGAAPRVRICPYLFI